MDAFTGALLDFNQDELDAIHLRALNDAYFRMGDRAEKAVDENLAPLFIEERTGIPHRSGHDRTRDEYLVARQRAMIEIATEALAQQEAEQKAAEAAKPTPDELARARVLRIHQRKLSGRLQAMTMAQRASWEAEVAVCNAGLASAEVRHAQPEVKIFTARLPELGVTPPDPNDIEALLEPEVHVTGVDGTAHAAEVERIKKKYGLDDETKPKPGRRR